MVYFKAIDLITKTLTPTVRGSRKLPTVITLYTVEFNSIAGKYVSQMCNVVLLLLIPIFSNEKNAFVSGLSLS